MEKLNFIKLQRANIEDIIITLDAIIENGGSRELSLAKTKLEEGKMWLGKHLGNIGGEDLNAIRDKELMYKTK